MTDVYMAQQQFRCHFEETLTRMMFENGLSASRECLPDIRQVLHQGEGLSACYLYFSIGIRIYNNLDRLCLCYLWPYSYVRP